MAGFRTFLSRESNDKGLERIQGILQFEYNRIDNTNPQTRMEWAGPNVVESFDLNRLWECPMEIVSNRHACRWKSILVLAAVVVLAGFRPGLAEDREIKELRQAAEQGDASAQFRLGGMFAQGEEVAENLVEAATWTRQAAEQGLARAQLRLGHMYHVGEGVPEDYREAATWYRKAAEQGDAEAQIALGRMYFIGRGVPKDDRAGVKWIRQAAEQRHPGAQTALGFMYRSGRGLLENHQEAVKWYRMAAEQGYASAQYELGDMYTKGEGVLEDYVLAYAWYILAAAQGEERAFTLKDELRPMISTEQVAGAQKLAAELSERIKSSKSKLLERIESSNDC